MEASTQQRSLNDRYMLWGSSWNLALYYGYTHDFFHVPVWQPNWMVWCVMQMYRSVGYILNGEVTLALTWTISSNCLFFKRTIILLLKIVQVSLISPKITSSFHKIVYVNHTLNNYIFIQN